MHVRGIKGCARCGEDHGILEMKKLHRAVYRQISSKADDQTTHTDYELMFTHWTPCPTTGDPILILSTHE